jgi:DNA-binding transcriptional LysR family regulator
MHVADRVPPVALRLTAFPVCLLERTLAELERESDMDVEVRHARVVAAVAEHGSISKASARLGLPQPSLSMQLRRIERVVGGELFVRSRSGVVPTALGESLIPMMIELAAYAASITAKAGAVLAGSVLRIGNVEWTPVGLQQSIVTALPGVEVHTETLDSSVTAIEAIDRGQIDAALVSGPLPDLGEWDDPTVLGTRTVVSEPVWIAVPEGSSQVRLEPGEPPQLHGLRWVQRTRDHSFHAVEAQFFESMLGAEPAAVHRVASNAEAMSWVREADVVALATPAAAGRGVALVDPGFGGPRDRMTLVWRRRAVDSHSVGELIGAIRAYYVEYLRAFPQFSAWLAAEPRRVPELLPLCAAL